MATVAKSYVGTIVAASLVRTGPITLKALTINAAATAVVTVWDNAAAAASGTILFQKNFAAATIYKLDLGDGIKVLNGIAITVATAAAQTTFYVD